MANLRIVQPAYFPVQLKTDLNAVISLKVLKRLGLGFVAPRAPGCATAYTVRA